MMTTEDLVVAAPPIVTTASSNHCSASESSTKIDEYGAATNSTRETSQNEHQQTEASITAAVEEDLLKVDVNEPNAKESVEDSSKNFFIRNNNDSDNNIISTSEYEEQQQQQIVQQQQEAEEEAAAGDNSNGEQQHSPTSLRRSTRVSALKAQRKLKEDPDPLLLTTMVQDHSQNNDIEMAPCDPETEEHGSSPQNPFLLKKKLKRKLDDGQTLDQYDCKFGIRLDGQGDVTMLSEGSEISSLNEEDVSEMRERYENQQKHGVSPEVSDERAYQIKQLEAALRLEETKLLMLKKIRQNQQQALLNKQQEPMKRQNTTVVGQNSSGHTYKPAVAVPMNQQAKVNGVAAPERRQGKGKASSGAAAAAASHQQQNANSSSGQISFASLPQQHQRLIQMLASNNSQQLCELLKTLNPQTANALTELLKQYALSQQQQQQPQLPQRHQPNSASQHQQNANASSAANNPTVSAAQQAKEAKAKEAAMQAATENALKTAREQTQQKISAARHQMRHDLEQQLSMLRPPKAPVPDMYFIPNGNQPDFCYLLGLDLTVQRVLKDKSIFKKMDFSPYRCEECETDFTTSWKAICDYKGEYHLYCENCVRQVQKRKVRHDYTLILKRAFQQVAQKEEEFEKQVSTGKFTVEPTIPPIVVQHQQQLAAAASTASAMIATAAQQASSRPTQQHNQQLNHSIASMTGAGSSTKAHPLPVTQHDHNMPSHQQQKAASTTSNVTQTASALNFSKAALNAMGNSHQQNAPMNAAAHNKPSKRVSNSQTNVQHNTSNGGSSSSNSNSNFNVFNNLLSSFTNSSALQSQLATAMMNPMFIRQMSQMNPMIAAALSNPMQLMMQAMISQPQQQHQQQQQQRIPTHQTSSNASSNNNQAMAAILQAVQQSSHQQSHQPQHQHHQPKVSTPSNTGGNSSSNSNSNSMAIAAMAALAGQMPSGGNNEQIMRQLQAYMTQMKSAGGVGGKKG